MEEVWIALIVSVLAPSAMVTLNWFLSRKTRQEEHARQDAIAANVAMVKTDLASNTQATVTKLDEIAEVTDKVHILVNQKLTNVTQRALDAHVGWLASLEEASAPPEQIARVTTLIAELREDLIDRAVRQAEVDGRDTTQ